MTRSERMLRINREREGKLTQWALATRSEPLQDEHISVLAGDWERERIANAERLAVAERELAHDSRNIEKQREWLAAGGQARGR